jgi:hypothetical protein
MGRIMTASPKFCIFGAGAIGGMLDLSPNGPW